MQRIVILGGYGAFGSLIAEQLAQSKAQLLIAGRDAKRGQTFAESLGAEFVRCDTRNMPSLRAAVAGAHLVINASGPFQAKNYFVPLVCIDQGCHYLDLGDGRAYVAGISELDGQAKARKVFVCVGASTTPAVTSALVAAMRPSSEGIRSIKIALTAGNKNQAGVATIASILAYVGLPVKVWRDGQWHDEFGWGLGEYLRFPGPIGTRRVQLCDVPDLELFPRLFRAQSVVFKAGVELTLLNYALGLLGRLRRLWPSLNLPGVAGPLVQVSKLFKMLGTFHGCVAVWVKGETGNDRALAFVAPQHGPRVPTSPAVLLARKLLASEAPAYGAFPCVGFITLTEFAEYLAPFGITLARQENGIWSTT